MTWSVVDTTAKNNMLSQINSALGTASKISWQTSGDVELAQTALNGAGNPFGSPSGGTMSLTSVPLTSTVFSNSGLAKAKLQTSGSTTILSAAVAAPSGADINCDALPTAGQQLRLDSLSLGIV